MRFRTLWDRRPLHYFWIMGEMSDNELRKLFQQTGRPAMSNDLTDRIMARVAVTPVFAPVEVKPLIGKAGWFAITVAFISVLGLLLNAASAGAINGEPSFLDPLWRSFPDPSSFKISIPTGQWTIWAAAGGALLLLFTLMDRALEKGIR